MNNGFEEQYEECTQRSSGFGEKLLYLVIGGGIGATLALLFAPKAGRELRADIAELASKRYDETLTAASELKERGAELYGTVKETRDEVVDVISAGATAIRKEVADDTEKIATIVGDHAKQAFTH